MDEMRCPQCGEVIPADDAGDREKCPHCGAPLKPEPEEDSAGGTTEKVQVSDEGPEPDAEDYIKIKPGDVLQGFRIESKVGGGGMGVVYKATQLSLNRTVALKILPKKYSSKPHFVRLFDSETATLASLNHPNIVSIIDRGREGDTYFFAMEYVPGTTLKRLVRARKVTVELFLRVFTQAAEALRYMHSRGIVHRDIKPGNIMLDEQSSVKIADFGLARILAEGEESPEGKGRVIGTVGYMSPEQKVDLNRTDERSDIFSLGAVMYRTLSGELPDRLPPLPPSRLRPDIDARLDEIVLRCLREDPTERYQNAGELSEALNAYRRDLNVVRKVCPRCNSENPLDEKKCLKCGADLSILLDLCPECGTDNPPDETVCAGCGANLKEIRERLAAAIGKHLDRARSLAEVGRYGEAIDELKDVTEVKGGLYEHARSQAQKLAARYTAERRARCDEALSKGRALAERGALSQAVKLWETIPDGVFEDVSMPQLLQDARAKMARSKKQVEQSSELMDQYKYDEAVKLLRQAAATWSNCPGLTDARYRLQALQQARQMVIHELDEVDRLLEKGTYEEARKALEHFGGAVPDDPLVAAKLREIQLRERRPRLESLVAEAKEAEEAGRLIEASRKWKELAELFGDDEKHKARLLERAESVLKKDEPEEIFDIESLVPETPKPQREATVRLGRARRGGIKKVAIAALVCLAAVVVIIVGTKIYESSGGGGGTGGSHAVHQPQPVAPAPDAPQPGPEAAPQQPRPVAPTARSRFFTEDFNDGQASNWDLTGGEWRVTTTGRRMLRSLTPDGEAAAVHKFYKEQTCAVEAWVRLDAAEDPRAAVAVAVRRNGNSEIRLSVARVGDVFAAQLGAVVEGEVLQQTAPTTLPVIGQAPFEGKLRIDASGDRAVARVDEAVVGTLEGLPPAVVRPGQVAVRASFCRASWDDVELMAAEKPKQPPAGGGEQPPVPAPEAAQAQRPPLAELKAAAGAHALALGVHSLRFAQSFDRNAAGWQATSGAWQHAAGGAGSGTPAGGTPGGGMPGAVPGGGAVRPVLAGAADGTYGFAVPAAGASLCTLGDFADMEVKGTVTSTVPDDPAGKSFGIYARYQDARNYVFFGIVGAGRGDAAGWTVQLVTCRDGRAKTTIAPGGPYRLDAQQQVDLSLTTLGTQACGCVGGTPIVTVADIGGAAPPVGKAALGIMGVVAVWNAVELRAVQPPHAGEAQRGLRLEIPKGAQVEWPDPPAIVRLVESGNSYVFLEDFSSLTGTVSVTVRFDQLKNYAQFSLCGAALGQRGPMAAELVNLQPPGLAAVSLIGVLPHQGGVRDVKYGGNTFDGLSFSQTVRLALSLGEGQVSCFLNKDAAAQYSPGQTPLPSAAGKWGFRSFDVRTTIERIDIEE